MNPTTSSINLNEIFSKNLEHVNNEIVHIAKVLETPVYINPLIENNSELKAFFLKTLIFKY